MMHAHVGQSAARRISLQDKTGELEIDKSRRAIRGPLRHPRRPVPTAAHAHHPHMLMTGGYAVSRRQQPHGFPRETHTHLDLRAHRDPLNMGGEDVEQKPLGLVSAVKANPIAEKAPRDTNARTSAAHNGPKYSRRLPTAHCPLSTVKITADGDAVLIRHHVERGSSGSR